MHECEALKMVVLEQHHQSYRSAIEWLQDELQRENCQTSGSNGMKILK